MSLASAVTQPPPLPHQPISFAIITGLGFLVHIGWRLARGDRSEQEMEDHVRNRAAGRHATGRQRALRLYRRMRRLILPFFYFFPSRTGRRPSSFRRWRTSNRKMSSDRPRVRLEAKKASLLAMGRLAEPQVRMPAPAIRVSRHHFITRQLIGSCELLGQSVSLFAPLCCLVCLV